MVDFYGGEGDVIRPVVAARGQVFGPLAAAVAAAVLLIHDQFTAADGTAISGRTPSPVNVPGNNWAAALGTAVWTIQGNKASKTGGGGHNLMVVSAADADVTITADVTVVNSAERQGVGLRATDVNNFWGVTWRNTNVVELVERNGGTLTVRASAALTLTPGSTYEFKVIASGSTITGYVNGVQYVTYGSATLNQTTTNHGLYAGSTGLPTWDNFKVFA